MNVRENILYRELLKEKIKTVLSKTQDCVCDESGKKVKATIYVILKRSICGLYPEQTITQCSVIDGFDEVSSEVSSEVLDYVLAEQDRHMIMRLAYMIEDECRGTRA